MDTHQVVIGLGSNVGNRFASLAAARLRLQTLSSTALRTSGIFESPPMGGEADAGPYLNQVVALDTQLDPVTLLETLKGFERILGRKTRGHWMSREIDLDILLYDNCTVQIGRLCIPHAGLHERQFMLVPMCDLSPQRAHPRTGLSFIDMLKNLERVKGKDPIVRVEDPHAST